MALPSPPSPSQAQARLAWPLQARVLKEGETRRMSWGALRVAAGPGGDAPGGGQRLGSAAFREAGAGARVLVCVCVQPCARGCGRQRLRTDALTVVPAGA